MSTMMKAFYVKGEDAGLRSIPVPVPGRNEVLIKVLRAGICNTDIEILKGYMGFEGVVGHEFVGIVKEIGKDTENFESTSKKLLNKRVCGDIIVHVSIWKTARTLGVTLAQPLPNTNCVGDLGEKRNV